MSKDPAFLFYPKDWLEGTAELLPNEKGVYIDLLCHQHQKGDLPIDTERLARMVGLGHDDFLKIWGILKDKFKEINNRYVNTRLSGVKKERADKGAKNTIIGTFAALLRKEKPEPKIYGILKKEFNVDDFLTESTEKGTERLIEWFNERLKSIAIANAIANGDVNKDINVNTTIYKTELEKKIEEFYNFRKQLKKPILDASKSAWLEKLVKISGGDENVSIEVLNQSIANGWQGIFELKTNNNGNKHKSATEIKPNKGFDD